MRAAELATAAVGVVTGGTPVPAERKEAVQELVWGRLGRTTLGASALARLHERPGEGSASIVASVLTDELRADPVFADALARSLGAPAGAGVPGTGTSGAGVSGTGTSGAGVSGTGTSGAGVSGTGTSGAGAPGTDASGAVPAEPVPTEAAPPGAAPDRDATAPRASTPPRAYTPQPDRTAPGPYADVPPVPPMPGVTPPVRRYPAAAPPPEAPDAADVRKILLLGIPQLIVMSILLAVFSENHAGRGIGYLLMLVSAGLAGYGLYLGAELLRRNVRSGVLVTAVVLCGLVLLRLLLALVVG